MKENSKTIEFDPCDLNGMLKIMDELGDSAELYDGKNENGETVLISVFTDKIVVRTSQSNGWERTNTYWRDGTCEETFSKD